MAAKPGIGSEVMVSSMTGYGRGKAESSGISAVVEIKTVNHRFCEYHIRMPRQLMSLEDKVKKTANQYIQRGRGEIFITIEEDKPASKRLKVDWDLADQFIGLMKDVQDKYQLSSAVTIQDMLQVDSLLSLEDRPAENEELSDLVFEALTQALEALKEMRLKEGSQLLKDLENLLQKLIRSAQKVKNFAPLVVRQYKDRLEHKIRDLSDGLIDDQRAVMEAAIFADKSDINEELTRLESHAVQFQETLALDAPAGRKLDFLIQEMNREVNTIGAKANYSDITKEVVEMKSLLEKMKEQVQNIE